MNGNGVSVVTRLLILYLKKTDLLVKPLLSGH